MMSHPLPHLHLHIPRVASWSWSEQELSGMLVTLLILALMLLWG